MTTSEKILLGILATTIAVIFITVTTTRHNAPAAPAAQPKPQHTDVYCAYDTREHAMQCDTNCQSLNVCNEPSQTWRMYRLPDKFKYRGPVT